MPENVIIIGSGPAGMTAAIYAARANLNPLLIEGFQAGGMPGGQLMTTSAVENFPGFPDGVDGQELMARMRKQAENHGTRLKMEDVTAVDLAGHPYKVISSNNETYESKALIIATGATARRLPIDSEAAFWNKGISACAVCDGGLPIFRNKELAVIGGGDSAVEEATHLTQFGSKVYLVHRRGTLRASKIMQKRAVEHPKIEILWNKTVAEFVGAEVLSGLKLKDTQTGEISKLAVAGCFEAIGHIPNTAFLKNQLEADEAGYLTTKADSTQSSKEGVYACGDVQDSKYRQAVSAAGTGCMAAIEAERWLQEKDLLDH
ncbi:MAG: thioredoxin-disulfide reductase [Chitinivibrionales bacterium]|nr:thioredoxin-disulfide reductase [Chitinivibrionales bacterium]